MPLTHAIIHRIHRSPDTKTALTLRNEELPQDEATANLLDKLKSSFFSRISREHGSFYNEGEETGPLETLLNNIDDNDQRFIAETISLSELLANGLDNANIGFTAFLMFFVEQAEQHHALYLFAAQQKTQLTLDKELAITHFSGIDFGQSLFGIKVDINEWKQEQNYAYLSAISPKAPPGLGELFQEISGFSGGIDKTEETQTFLEAVESFAEELPADTVDDYRSQVVGYCLDRDREDEPVDIKELALNLSDVDREAFVENVQLGRPVRMDKRSLQRYVKFSGREKDLAISFSSTQLNKRVRYDADSDTLSINGIPRALRDQLLGHLKKP